MTLNKEAIEALLFEEEGTTIDFKSEQYKFENEDERTKSELLKDILAFANAWRRSDAYILIGVKKVPGKQGEVLGVSLHVDDAKLQQFVNTKTQRPVSFSYKAVKCQGKDIAIIHIPKQERPIYLDKDFGKLEKNTVYIRRGSATDIATLDEVSKMRIDDASSNLSNPRLDISFYDNNRDCLIGQILNIECSILNITDPENIPDYGYTIGMGLSINVPLINVDYWRDLVKYISFIRSVHPVELAIKNIDTVSANDVRVEITIEDPSREMIIYESSDKPSRPEKNMMFKVHPLPKSIDQYLVEYKNAGYWKIITNIERIHPKRNMPIPGFIFIGSNVTNTYEAKVTIYADNITEPITSTLNLKVNSDRVNLSWNDFYSKIRKHA